MPTQTSLKAYREEVRPTLTKRENAVLEAFKERKTFTNQELADFLDWPINCVTGRTNSLRRKGILRIHCKRPDGVTHRLAQCQEINLELKQAHLL